MIRIKEKIMKQEKKIIEKTKPEGDPMEQLIKLTNLWKM